MSFILDALKKAERERALARVPTLSTVHIPVVTTGRRVGLWVAAGVFLIGGGASIWLWGPSPPVAPSTATNSRAQAGTTLPANPADPALTPTPARAIEATPPASVAPVPPPSVVAEQRKDPQPPSPAPATTPRSTQALRRQSSASDMLAASSGQVRGGGGRPMANPSDQLPSSPTPQTESAPAPAPPQAAPSPGAARPPAVVVAPSPPAVPATPPPLVDAMAKMRLDLFVYTDVPADRMIIINGRKYVEGEQVDGLYRIESITREGVLLSYKDEKLVLRP